MKIAFVHYHLKTGGVTTVIKQQIQSLQTACQVLTITGEAPASPFPGPVACIPGLGYERPGVAPLEPEKVADTVLAAIRKQWPQGCDLLHVHNPLLAKNRHFLDILKILQQKDIKLLLQIHDFAEDGRPWVYFKNAYPADCHYAVINSRDYRILRQAGLQSQGVHLLFNNIDPLPHGGCDHPLAPYILYPIRAIRRKNIGEAILLSKFLKGDETLGITLPPHSPADMPSYSAWKRFVADNRLNVAFELGQQHAFAELVGSARSLITTSVNEGFGFSFLEPWTAHKMLWGRKLPDICHDFEKNGVDLGHLYTQLSIPLKWIDRDRFYTQWRETIADAGALFDHPIESRHIEEVWAQITCNDTIDFGLLHERFQQQVIKMVITQAHGMAALVERNPLLGQPGQVINRNDLVSNNNAAVLTHYTGKGYRDRLLATYQHVTSTPVRHRIDKGTLINQFLDLNNFSLLKWKPYA
jgi:hypothetical protein